MVDECVFCGVENEFSRVSQVSCRCVPLCYQLPFYMTGAVSAT